MLYDYFVQLGPYFSWIGLFCGVFFFMYSVRYYIVSILVLMKDQKSLQEHIEEESAKANLGFNITKVDMEAHLKGRFKKLFSPRRKLGFKTTRVKTEKLMTSVERKEAGFVTQKIDMATNQRFQKVVKKLRSIYWDIKVKKDKIVVYPARIGIRKQLHAMMMFFIQKANYDDLKQMALTYWFEAKQYMSGVKSMTVEKKDALLQANKLNSHHNYDCKYLGFTKTEVGVTRKLANMAKKTKALIAHDSIHIVDDPELQPFISIHLAFYNEENVAERCIEACLAQDYEQYEIVIADDSNDGTAAVLAKYEHNPKIKVVRRDNREGYKGGALKVAIEQTDKRAKFITVYDADFVPPPNTLKNFMREFFIQNGKTFDLESEERNLAAVQGYQWHILNKDENFVTAGIRFGFAGGYMVERVAQQYFGAMKMIAGSVFVIRRDVMEEFGWQMPDGYTSIVEDWNLTIRMYLAGWKIGYTPDIKVPAECVNSLSRLSKQQIRWAEGHTWNVKTYFWKVMTSAKMSLIEKLEFLHYGPFYLQSAFFIIGTFGWIVGELIFHAKVPGWTATLGWSLVFTNLMALPVMCISGIVLERGENRDYNILPFLTFVYYIIPSLAYASVRGLVSTHESGWVRTKKTGSVTDGVIEGHMAGDKKELVDKNVEIFKEGIEKAAAQYQKSHPMFKAKPTITEDLAKGRLWMELKRVPRLGFLIILILSITVGSLGYIATTEKTLASPDVLYLNSPQYLSYYSANSPQEVAIGPNNTSYSWVSDMCPTGDDPGGVAAGNYSAYLVLNQKPTVDKVYSVSVGHVNETGGDYQGITSTTITINQSTPSLLSINLGNGPEIVCNPDNKRKMVFSIEYLYAPSGCDLDCGSDDDGECPCICNGEECACDGSGAVEQCDISASVEEPTSKTFIEPTVVENEEVLTEDVSDKKVKKDKKNKKLSFDLNSFTIQKAQACEVPECTEINSVELMDYLIEYNGMTYDSVYDQTTFSYTATGQSARYNLSNIIFELCAGTNIVSYSPASSTEIGYDKKHDIYGIKWEIELGPNESQNYSFTLDGKHCECDIQTGVKAGRYRESGSITGPSCSPCPAGEDIELDVANDCEQVDLNWTEYTDQTISGYKVLRSTTDSTPTYPDDYYQYLSGQSTTTYSDTNVTEGQGYYYRIGAYYDGEIVSYSDTEYIEYQPENCGPSEDITLTGEPTCDGNQLDWTEFTGQTISGYKVIRSTTDPDLTYPEDGYITYISNPSTTSYLDTDVIDGQAYYYRVGAYYNGTIVSYSNTINITTDTDCPPDDCCDDDLVIEFNNATSTLSTPSIIVPEFTLLLGAPLAGYWYMKRKKKQNNIQKK